ncbi:MAG: dienelactone hydrolase family protein [Acidimicrobiales bacterium]
MTNSLRTDHVTVEDGTFDMHVWRPAAGQGPGILLLQEIFGVGPYIRAVGERLADLGYVVGAPDVFWRLSPHWEADHSTEGLTQSIELVGKFDFTTGVTDCVAALNRLRELPEVHRGVGVMGFCLGGLLTYQVAAHGDPDVAVSYYGSNTASFLDLAPKITCPIMFHYGGNDPYIPNEQVEQIRATFESRTDAHVHVESEAGHAFDNHEAAMFHNPEAAQRAWARTTAFLASHLPVG